LKLTYPIYTNKPSCLFYLTPLAPHHISSIPSQSRGRAPTTLTPTPRLLLHRLQCLPSRCNRTCPTSQRALCRRKRSTTCRHPAGMAPRFRPQNATIRYVFPILAKCPYSRSTSRMATPHMAICLRIRRRLPFHHRHIPTLTLLSHQPRHHESIHQQLSCLPSLLMVGTPCVQNHRAHPRNPRRTLPVVSNSHQRVGDQILIF